MLRKILIIVSVLLVLTSAMSFAENNYYQLDEAEQGVLIVTYPVSTGVKYKAMLQRGNEKYYYDLTSNEVRIPLQMGAGTYKLAVLRHRSGNTYAFKYETTFRVKEIIDTETYLDSTLNVNWAPSDIAIQRVSKLVTDDMSDEVKLETIHSFLAEKLTYDYTKFDKIKGAYLPDIDETYMSKEGICYDFASLLAAMLRSEGIQTKLVMGYRSDTTVYHAWNEVYIDGQWLTVDLTLDVEYFSKGYMYELYKDSSFYDVMAEY
jgi:transglutaminase-like putative cysteine protease